jgi:hypothetical protein
MSITSKKGRDMRTSQGATVPVAATTLSAVLLFAAPAAAGQTTPQATAPAVKKDQGVSPVLPCPDLAIKLTIAKSIVGGNSILTLNGSVCNLGALDYVVPPAAPVDAECLVYAWHPPRTAMQENDVRQLAHQSIGSRLNASGCITYNQTYTIPNVTRWDNPWAMRGERPVVKEFVLRLNKRYPQGDRFTRNEDCSADNNAVALAVPYMEKTP